MRSAAEGACGRSRLTRSPSPCGSSQSSGTRPSSSSSVVRPRLVEARVEEARSRSSSSPVVSVSVAGDRRSRRRRLADADGVVLLAALAAERERQQRPSSRSSGDELLLLGRDVPAVLGLERRVDGLAAAEELVQPEREDREPGLRVRAARSPASASRGSRSRSVLDRGPVSSASSVGGAVGRRRSAAACARRSRPVPGSSSSPNVVSIQDASGSARNASSSVGRRRVDRRASAATVASSSSRRRGRATQRLADHVLGSTAAPNSSEATRATSARCSSSVPGPASVADVPTHCSSVAWHASRTRRQSSADVGALPAAVGVQLVEDEEPQALRRARRACARCGRVRMQLEHHVVRQQDVRRVREDRLALLVALLAGVAAERDRPGRARRADAEELLELADLAVGQRVHRVDDDRLDPRARPVTQHVVDDRDDVGEALARAGAGRQHVVRAGARDLDRLALVAVQPQRLARPGRARSCRARRSASHRASRSPSRDELVDQCRPARTPG